MLKDVYEAEVDLYYQPLFSSENSPRFTSRIIPDMFDARERRENQNGNGGYSECVTISSEDLEQARVFPNTHFPALCPRPVTHYWREKKAGHREKAGDDKKHSHAESMVSDA